MNMDEVWKNYKKMIQAFLYSKLSNKDDADDLLQEIMIKIHNNLDSLESQKRMKPWLYAIANNTIIDYYRKQSKQKASVEYDEAVSLFIHEVPEIKADLSNCISPFIDVLPNEMSHMLRAIDLEGQSQKSYAHDLNINYSTLKSRLQKSRKALRGLFDQCCRFDFDKNGNVYDYDQKSANCSNSK